MESRGDAKNNKLLFQGAMQNAWTGHIFPFLNKKDVWQLALICKDARKIALMYLKKFHHFPSLISDEKSFIGNISRVRKKQFSRLGQILFGNIADTDDVILLQAPRYVFAFVALMGVIIYDGAQHRARNDPQNMNWEEYKRATENSPVLIQTGLAIFLVLSLVMILINLVQSYRDIRDDYREIGDYQQKKERVTNVISVLFPEQRKSYLTKVFSKCCGNRK